MENRSTKNTEKNGLTAAQADVFEFIKSRCLEGSPPSYREIQKHFGYKAVGTVQDYVKALIKKGVLEKPDKKNRKARTIMPIGHRLEKANRIPIYGEVAAGATRQAEEIELGQTVVSQTMSRNPSFALRVTGDSMVEVGIYDGDIIIVERGAQVRNDDIVVALLDGETTVKTYQKKQGKIFLKPENKRMKPIPITKQEFQIQGKVVGLQRKF